MVTIPIQQSFWPSNRFLAALLKSQYWKNYYMCPNYKGKINPVQENVKTVSCSYGLTMKKAVLVDLFLALWSSTRMVTLFEQLYSVMCWKKILHQIISQGTKHRSFFENGKFPNETERTLMNITNLTLKELS